MDKLQFHKWKDEQVKKDSKEHGVLFLRERDWYWAEYGRYCKKSEEVAHAHSMR